MPSFSRPGLLAAGGCPALVSGAPWAVSGGLTIAACRMADPTLPVCGRPLRSTARPTGGHVAGRLAYGVLLSVCIAPLPSLAQAQGHCEIEEAQRLFSERPRQTPEIERLLAACQAVGSTDYRVYMFLGVIARDAGDRAQAITYLRRAHDMAPQEANAALELGFTLEARHPGQAREVYEHILAGDPAARPAALGLARVARRQNRLDEARALYQRLLAVNPEDPQALNGMAWLALAERNREQARAGFEAVLTIEPENEEAKTGLSHAPDVYRYLLDISGEAVSTRLGTSWGYGARATVGVTPFDTLEMGWRQYTDELTSVSAAGFATLPSQNITVGYHRLTPLSHAFSLVYQYRGYDNLPTEHWIDASAAINVTEGLRWFGGYRQSFGAPRYEGRLIRTGLSASFARSWDVAAAIYNSSQPDIGDGRDLWSWGVDVTYSGPRNLLLSVGGGYSPLIENVDLHAHAILPVTDRIALQFMAAHNSTNADTRANAGLVFTW